MRVLWFSAGVSSAVAAYVSKPDRMVYIDIADQHPDSMRFLRDCEQWLGREIEIIKPELESVEKCCLAAGFVRSPWDAACTNRLKKRERRIWERANGDEHTYIWGLDANERKRMLGIERAMPKNGHEFPLVELGWNKSFIHGFLRDQGIQRPAMYDMGYNNNNCIGCIKGGAGYWNKIRVDFPEVFAARSAMERVIGGHILSDCFLDELDPEVGRLTPFVLPDCGMFCDLELWKLDKEEASK